MRPILALIGLFSASAAPAEPADPAGPIIDVHRHAAWPGSDDAAYRSKVLEELDENGVVMSLLHLNEPTDVEDWAVAEPERFIAGPMFPCPRNRAEPLYRCFAGSAGWPDLQWLESQLAAGRIKMLGEMLFVYAGVHPDDPRMRPYWQLAARYDVPVSVHINRGPPPGGRNSLRSDPNCCPDFDGELGNPALLRPILDRHPGLRIILVHTGVGFPPGYEPFSEETIALLNDYRSVHVELSILNSVAPAELHEAELRRLIDAGFGDRIMFGSDNLPLQRIIARMEAVEWLTPGQRRAIYYDNAARFFRLEAETIARHRQQHGIVE